MELSPVRAGTKRNYRPREAMWPGVELQTAGDPETFWYSHWKSHQIYNSEAILILPGLANYYMNQGSNFSVYLKDKQLFPAKTITHYYEVYNLHRTHFTPRVQRLGRGTCKYIIIGPFTRCKTRVLFESSDALKLYILNLSTTINNNKISIINKPTVEKI